MAKGAAGVQRLRASRVTKLVNSLRMAFRKQKRRARARSVQRGLVFVRRGACMCVCVRTYVRTYIHTRARSVLILGDGKDWDMGGGSGRCQFKWQWGGE